jgi:hypothetical protein
MDDFVLSNLQESKNEWCARLVNIFTPLVIDGFRSIFNEAWKMCNENNEISKYLMTFQNLICRVPKWNNEIISEERMRIIKKSGCNYLEDLITCVHIIQLKVLTSVRVGNKQKKIDISIPKLDDFIHKIYINSARKIYMNIYLFEKNINPLQIQKNNRELEYIIQDCILITIRESIPTESIIRAYLDESVELEEEITIENIEQPILKSDDDNANTVIEEKDMDISSSKENTPLPETIPSIRNIDNEAVITRLSFNDYDSVLDEKDKIDTVNAPKTIERLEEISSNRAFQRKLDEDGDDDNDSIKITDDNILLEGFDDISNDLSGSNDDLFIDFEEL